MCDVLPPNFCHKRVRAPRGARGWLPCGWLPCEPTRLTLDTSDTCHSTARYVDSLESAADVGGATALLSYSWMNPIKDVTEALEAWTRDTHRHPKQTYIWICSLCLNQHRMVKTLTPDELAAEFGPRVTTIGRILPLMHPYVARAHRAHSYSFFLARVASLLWALCVVHLSAPSDQAHS